MMVSSHAPAALDHLPDAPSCASISGDHAVIDRADAAKVVVAPIVHLARDTRPELRPLLQAEVIGEIGMALRLRLPTCRAPKAGPSAGS